MTFKIGQTIQFQVVNRMGNELKSGDYDACFEFIKKHFGHYTDLEMQSAGIRIQPMPPAYVEARKWR